MGVAFQEDWVCEWQEAERIVVALREVGLKVESWRERDAAASEEGPLKGRGVEDEADEEGLFCVSLGRFESPGAMELCGTDGQRHKRSARREPEVLLVLSKTRQGQVGVSLLYGMKPDSPLVVRVGEVPAGYAVRFDRAVRKNGLGGSSEYLFGEITIRGRTYPMNYYLTSDVYPDAWRRMYGVFEVRE